MRWNPHPGAQAAFFAVGRSATALALVRPQSLDEAMLRCLRYFNGERAVVDWLIKRGLLQAGEVRRFHSRFDVGHEMVLPERARKRQP